LVGLLSRYKGKLGGVVGLSGYLPLSGKVGRSWSDAKQEGQSITRWFLAHGSRDQLVPRRMFTSYKEKLGAWEGDKVEAKVYEGMAHTSSGPEIRDLCSWLEKVVSMA
jgi:lysophospholipase-2